MGNVGAEDEDVDAVALNDDVVAVVVVAAAADYDSVVVVVVVSNDTVLDFHDILIIAFDEKLVI